MECQCFPASRSVRGTYDSFLSEKLNDPYEDKQQSDLICIILWGQEKFSMLLHDLNDFK